MHTDNDHLTEVQYLKAFYRLPKTAFSMILYTIMPKWESLCLSKQ